MPRHPLKREIIATHVTNSMINRVGSTFVHRLMETTGAQARTKSCAPICSTARSSASSTLWQQIEALDNKVDDAVQSAMLIDTARLIDRGTMWFLRSRRLGDDMATTIAHFAPRVEALATRLPQLLDAADAPASTPRSPRYVAQGVPQRLATRVVTFDTLYATLDIVEVAEADEASGRARRRDLLRPRDAARPAVAARAGSPRCPATRIGRCSPRARCRTICPDCSARSPPRCWPAARDATRRAADRRLAGSQSARHRARGATAGRTAQARSDRCGDALGGAAGVAQPG